MIRLATLVSYLVFTFAFSIGTPSVWCGDGDSGNAPDSVYQSTVERLQSLVRTNHTGPVSAELLQDIRTIFQESPYKQDVIRQQEQGQSNNKKINVIEIANLIELVGQLNIAEVTQELADHLTILPTLPRSDGLNVYKSRPVIQVLKTFGEVGVPAVFDRMRIEVQYDDQLSYDYWSCATFYLEEVYGKDTDTMLRSMIRDEQNIPMRERLVSLVLPHAEKYVKYEIPRQARRQELKERYPDMDKPSVQSLAKREEMIAAWRSRVDNGGAVMQTQ